MGVRIVVVDRQPLFSRGLELLLPAVSEDRVQVVAATDATDAAAGLARHHAPDLVLVDLGLGPPGGLRAAAAVLRTEPRIAVLAMVAGHTEEDDLLHYHQMQWLRAIQDLEADGLDKLPVPDAFDVDQESPVMDAAYQFIDCSDGTQAAEGSWVGTDAMDGSGCTFTAVKGEPGGDRAQLPPGDPRLYGTPPPDKAPKASS